MAEGSLMRDTIQLQGYRYWCCWNDCHKTEQYGATLLVQENYHTV
jgi:hypothetical protein